MNRHRLQQDWAEAGWFARAVVAKRVTALAGVGIISGELVRDGVIPVNMATTATHWTGVAFSVLGVASGVLWAHRASTPADPQLGPTDRHGNRLVSELSIGPHAGVDTAESTGPAALEAANAIHPMESPTSAPEAPSS